MLEFALSILATIRAFFRSRRDTALEVLALRQQVAVLKRKRPRPTFIRTIEAAEVVSFSFLPGQLVALANAKVPEEVIKAMAARSSQGPRVPSAAASVPGGRITRTPATKTEADRASGGKPNNRATAGPR